MLRMEERIKTAEEYVKVCFSLFTTKPYVHNPVLSFAETEYCFPVPQSLLSQSSFKIAACKSI